MGAGVGAGVEFGVCGDAAAPDGRQLLLRQVPLVEIRRRDDDERADGVLGGEDVSRRRPGDHVASVQRP